MKGAVVIETIDSILERLVQAVLDDGESRGGYYREDD